MDNLFNINELNIKLLFEEPDVHIVNMQEEILIEKSDNIFIETTLELIQKLTVQTKKKIKRLVVGDRPQIIITRKLSRVKFHIFFSFFFTFK